MMDTKSTHKIPELLAPAGSFEKLVTAIHYGADAVYLGGKQYSLRAHATNFAEDDLAKAVNYAHEKNVKVYVTVNIFAHEPDMVHLDEYLLSLGKAGIDGIIISDPGIIMRARVLLPEIPIHLSTQANVTNLQSALFWQKQGVSRLNMARELSIKEIAAIKKGLLDAKTSTKVEVFVHGAVCISYSGRCMLSSYMTGRSANRGDCAHPCRYSYTLLEEKRPGQHFPVEEDARGTYIFNAKDICLLNRLPELIEAGTDSLKIEGRMKSIYYVGGIVRVYRAALDYIGEKLDAGESPVLPDSYMEELSRVGTRGFSENFADRPPGGEEMIYDSPRLIQQYAPIGVIRRVCSADQIEIEVRNPIHPGEKIEYMGRGITNTPFTIKTILNQNNETVERANPGNIVTLTDLPASTDWLVNGLLRRKNAPTDAPGHSR
jgi:putative protease